MHAKSRAAVLGFLCCLDLASSFSSMRAFHRQGCGARQAVACSRARDVASQFFESDKSPVILYDGVCNLCNAGVNFMLDWDSPHKINGNFRFASLQSLAGKVLLVRGGRREDDISTIVLVMPDGTVHTKSDAVLRIAAGLGHGTVVDPVAPLLQGAAMAATILIPGPIRDSIYELISTNRYGLLGCRDECRLSDDRYGARFVPDSALDPAAAAAFLATRRPASAAAGSASRQTPPAAAAAAVGVGGAAA